VSSVELLLGRRPFRAIERLMQLLPYAVRGKITGEVMITESREECKS
jgi:hypothetical protein